MLWLIYGSFWTGFAQTGSESDIRQPESRSEYSDLSKLSFKAQLELRCPRIHKEPREKSYTPGSLGIANNVRNGTRFPLNKARKHNENQSNTIDMTIEPNFSEKSTNLLGVIKFSLKTENTTSGTVIQKKTRIHLSLWHAYSGISIIIVP